MEDISRERLKQLLDEKGWTQKRLSEECGYTPQYISYLITGSRPIVKENAKIIGEVLGVLPEYILGTIDYKRFEDTPMDYFQEIWKKKKLYLDSLGYNFKEKISTDNGKIGYSYIISKGNKEKEILVCELKNIIDEIEEFIIFKIEKALK